MATEHKVSFARTPGAGTTSVVTPPAPAQTSTPAAPLAPAPAAPLAPAPAAQASNATPQSSSENTQLSVPSGTNSLGFYTGDEEIPETGGDQRTPWLSLVQPTTKNKQIGDSIVADGTFVFKKNVALDGKKGFRAIPVGFRPKFYVEKLKYIQNPGPNDPKPRTAQSFEEVTAMGGTVTWKLSSQNKDSQDRPLYNTPYFEAHIQCLVLIECPDGVSDENFPVVIDGKAHAPALFEAKGGSFSSFFIPINTEYRGLFQKKWCSRYVNVSSRQNQKNPAYAAVASVGAPTSEALQAYITAELAK